MALLDRMPQVLEQLRAMLQGCRRWPAGHLMG